MRLPAGPGAACPIDVDEGLGRDVDRPSPDGEIVAAAAHETDAAEMSAGVAYGLAALVAGVIGFIAFVALRFYVNAA